MSEYTDYGFSDDGFDLDPSDFQSQPQEQSLENPAPGQDPIATSDPGQQPPAEQMFNVRFNHEDLQIPMSEAQSYIQRGMNYDKVYEKMQSLENDPGRTWLTKLSEEQGMSPEDFIQAFEHERMQAKVERLMENNIPREYAEEMIANQQFRQQWEEQQAAAQREAEETAQYQAFFRQFKNLTGRDYNHETDYPSEDVWAMYDQGMPLEYAFMHSHMANLQNQINQMQQQQLNQNRSPIGSTSNYGTSDPNGHDLFLEGFNSI